MSAAASSRCTEPEIRRHEPAIPVRPNELGERGGGSASLFRRGRARLEGGHDRAAALRARRPRPCRPARRRHGAGDGFLSATCSAARSSGPCPNMAWCSFAPAPSLIDLVDIGAAEGAWAKPPVAGRPQRRPCLPRHRLSGTRRRCAPSSPRTESPSSRRALAQRRARRRPLLLRRRIPAAMSWS